MSHEQDGDVCTAIIKEYPRREIFAFGRYIPCQILNWEDGPPPTFLICHPLHPDYREEFLATQGMGTWMRVDLRDVLRKLGNPPLKTAHQSEETK